MLKEELKIILVNKCKNRKKRRFWVRQWILRRNQWGASDTLLKELTLEDKEGYKYHLRKSEEQYNELLIFKINNYFKNIDNIDNKIQCICMSDWLEMN